MLNTGNATVIKTQLSGGSRQLAKPMPCSCDGIPHGVPRKHWGDGLVKWGEEGNLLGTGRACGGLEGRGQALQEREQRGQGLGAEKRCAPRRQKASTSQVGAVGRREREGRVMGKGCQLHWKDTGKTLRSLHQESGDQKWALGA